MNSFTILLAVKFTKLIFQVKNLLETFLLTSSTTSPSPSHLTKHTHRNFTSLQLLANKKYFKKLKEEEEEIKIYIKRRRRNKKIY